VKPRTWAKGENGRRMPTATLVTVAAASGVLGRLRKKGTRRVRIAKMTRLWVARDSTNQPDWKRDEWAWKTQIMIPKVMKSKIELIGPKKIMKRRMNPVSQWAGRWSCSSSTLSVGIVISLAS